MNKRKIGRAIQRFERAVRIDEGVTTGQASDVQLARKAGVEYARAKENLLTVIGSEAGGEAGGTDTPPVRRTRRRRAARPTEAASPDLSAAQF